jgi:hypothetical protein
LFPWQLWQFFQPIPILLAYLVPLDVVVTGNITAKICEVWSSEFNIFPTKSESVGQTATVAMETKKGGFNFFFYSFHQTS